ncbi:MAG: VanW family protein [Nocardioides sp.]|uniref:VanW family protein n=1 Tax=Nocardioides sp. TaxID=35761 RepID=UPI003F0899B1
MSQTPRARVPLSRRFPLLLPLAVAFHRTRRSARWLLSDADWATGRAEQSLPVRVARHDSVLVRDLGSGLTALQHGKVTNLRLASPRIDGLLVGPGETFSFNRVVGNCTRRKGYVDGLRLANGEPSAGVGGGICQIANMLHWLVLHSDLTVVERSEHSFDAFPDTERVVPWGVGCTIVHNYVDLVVRNDTDLTFQFRLAVSATHLHGELLADRPPEHDYVVEARHERFERSGAAVHRSNEIWRTARSRVDGTVRGEELVKSNRALVMYEPDPSRVVEV